MIAVLEARCAGLYAKKYWIQNVVAGAIVGIVALPLAMAFAIASGAKPEQGIYTAIIGGILVSLLGGSRIQIAGPTGAFIVILSGITAKYGVAGLRVATLMAGVMLLVMGLARMGGVIKFIPAPVIVGFTAGVGVIIFAGQWRDFLGLPKTYGDHFHEKLWQLLLAMPHVHLPTVARALLSLLLVLFSQRIKGLSRVPGPLVAMVIASVIQWAVQIPGVATIGSAFGGIVQGLPSFSVPDVSVSLVIQLIGPAFTIAMLGAIESLLSAVVADGLSSTRHDSNQELIGQGIANVVVPLFGGFAATGVILAILQFLRRMSEVVETQRIDEKTLKRELAELELADLPHGVMVYEIVGLMFFGAVETFERAVIHIHTQPSILIIRLRQVPFMDITGIQTLAEVIGKFQKRGVRVVLCEANERVFGKLRNAGVLATLRDGEYEETFKAALVHVFSVQTPNEGAG